MRSNSSTLTTSPLVGWVPESGGRGTLSLVLSSLLVVFICTWVVIHRRVYASEWLGRFHKIALFLKAIIAPEFIAVEGLQEWSQARRMVEDCCELTGELGPGDENLEVIHAFYIGMLALRYRSPRGARVIWPNQYVWLLQNKLIDWKDHAAWSLSKKDILDKSNSDNFAKLTALFQVSWFVAQSIIRLAHKLPLAPLESMTISYIPLFAVTYFFWWHKPKDIMTPSLVDLPNMAPEELEKFESLSVSHAFDDEEVEKQSLWEIIWTLTPRVFEKEAEMEAIRRAEYEAELSTGKNDSSGPIKLKQERVVAHWDPTLYRSKIWPLICLFGASFGALHLICWDTPFPTLVEEWLWRAAAFTSVISLIVFMHFEKVVVRWGGPLTILSIVSPAVYLASRVVMIAGAIAAFRGSDPALYETYVISNYWIHVF